MFLRLGLFMTSVFLACSCSNSSNHLYGHKTSEPYDPIPGVPEIAKRPSKPTSSAQRYRRSSSTSRKKTKVRYYRVQSGDTLWRIGQRHGVHWQKIKKANALRGSSIRVGQRLKIPY